MKRWAWRLGWRALAAAAALLLVGYGVGSLVGRRAPQTTAIRGIAKDAGPAAGGAQSLVQQVAPGAVSGGGGDTGAATAGEGAGTVAQPAAPAGGGSVPGSLQQIVRTADVTVEVKKGTFDDAWTRATAIATRLGGYVASSNRGTPSPVPLGERSGSGSGEAAAAQPASGDITIRIPVARFDQAVTELRALGKSRGEQLSSEDVTQQFVDLESRLRNQRSQQAVLIQLMAQAKNVSETLAVQQQLALVEDQIEQMTGRLNALRKLTALSTVTLHLFEPGAVGAPTPPPEPGPSFVKAWHTAIDGLARMGTVFMIGAMWLAPFALVVAVGLWLRRFRTRPAAPTV